MNADHCGRTHDDCMLCADRLAGRCPHPIAVQIALGGIYNATAERVNRGAQLHELQRRWGGADLREIGKAEAAYHLALIKEAEYSRVIADYFGPRATPCP